MFKRGLFIINLMFVYCNTYAQDVYRNELLDYYLPKFLERVSKRKIKKINEQAIYFYDESSFNYLIDDRDSLFRISPFDPKEFLEYKSSNAIIHVFPCENSMYSYSKNLGNVILHIEEGVENSRKVVYCQIYKIKKVKEKVLGNGNHTDMYIKKIILSRKFKVSEDK